ncbi:MAG: serine hydrolase [Gemmatimonadota bacterium]|nr:serine hydrolase [Gemmatimonadota bacterium]MDH3369101.1 serine hydrolase [Gemmatimonadota bacterium]MDH3478788.1 serine hydrolase [Gemmatimonadota bacterium]MDH5548313.1 serine hydrolase [Gemmatimonadota bacterium]
MQGDARVIKRILVVVAAAVGLVAPSLAYGQAPTIPDEVRQSVQARVDHAYNTGIVIGLVTPGGTTYSVYGSRDSTGAPVDEHTVFEIGSITKAFTGILLADMVRRGEVALDDPIHKYLPPTVTVPMRDGRPITMVDLATHTSGLPRLPTNLTPSDPANPYADYTVEQLYAFLSGHTLRRDVGAEYEYSNYGFGLLGHVLALRAGTTYEALIAARMANTLGMTSTGIALTPDMRARLAQGHVGTTAVSQWDIPTLAGAGALRSTAGDMVRFVRANMGLLTTPLLPAMEASHEPRHRAGSDAMQIGLGWHILTRDGRQIVWHNGGTGGYRSFVGFRRDGSRGVVVLTNSNRSADDIGYHLLDPGLPLEEVRVAVAVDPGVLAEYSGRYQLAPGVVFDVTAEDGRLFAQLTGQPRFEVYPSSSTEFFYTVVDAQLSFVVEQGKIVALTLHQNGRDMRAAWIP